MSLSKPVGGITVKSLSYQAIHTPSAIEALLHCLPRFSISRPEWKTWRIFLNFKLIFESKIILSSISIFSFNKWKAIRLPHWNLNRLHKGIIIHILFCFKWITWGSEIFSKFLHTGRLKIIQLMACISFMAKILTSSSVSCDGRW